jgi:hypothetical protein
MKNKIKYKITTYFLEKEALFNKFFPKRFFILSIALYKAIDNVKDRFGKNLLTRASSSKK